MFFHTNDYLSTKPYTNINYGAQKHPSDLNTPIPPNHSIGNTTARGFLYLLTICIVFACSTGFHTAIAGEKDYLKNKTEEINKTKDSLMKKCRELEKEIESQSKREITEETCKTYKNKLDELDKEINDYKKNLDELQNYISKYGDAKKARYIANESMVRERVQGWENYKTNRERIKEIDKRISQLEDMQKNKSITTEESVKIEQELIRLKSERTLRNDKNIKHRKYYEDTDLTIFQDWEEAQKIIDEMNINKNELEDAKSSIKHGNFKKLKDCLKKLIKKSNELTGILIPIDKGKTTNVNGKHYRWSFAVAPVEGIDIYDIHIDIYSPGMKIIETKNDKYPDDWEEKINEDGSSIHWRNKINQPLSRNPNDRRKERFAFFTDNKPKSGKKLQFSYYFTDKDGNQIPCSDRGSKDTPLDYALISVPLDSALISGDVIAATDGHDAASGDIFTFDLTNTTDEEITVEIPTGMVFTPSDQRYQEMIIGRDYTVPLSPHQTTAVDVYGYCLDPEKLPPATSVQDPRLSYAPLYLPDLPESKQQEYVYLGTIVETGRELGEAGRYETPLPPEEEEKTVTQWTLWHVRKPDVYTAEKLEADITRQFEEAGQPVNEPAVREEIKQGASKIWEGVNLTLKESQKRVTSVPVL